MAVKPNKTKLKAYSKKLKETLKTKVKPKAKPKVKPVPKKKKVLGLTIRGGSARNTGGKK